MERIAQSPLPSLVDENNVLIEHELSRVQRITPDNVAVFTDYAIVFPTW